MAIVHVGEAGLAGSTVASPQTITYSSTAGNTLIITGHLYDLNNGAFVAPTSVTDTAGNVWNVSTNSANTALVTPSGSGSIPPTASLLDPDDGATSHQSDWVAWSVGAHAVTSVTIAWAGAVTTFARVALAEYSGVVQFDNSWAGGSATAGASGSVSAALTVHVTGELAVGAVDFGGAGTPAIPTGWTQNTSSGGQCAFLIGPSVGAFAPTWTDTVAGSYTGAAALFSPVSLGGQGPSAQPVPPGLQSPMSLGVPTRPATQPPPAPPVTAVASPQPQLVPPGLQSPMVLAEPPRFAIPPPPVQQPAPAPQPVPPGLQSPMSLAVPSRPATFNPPPPQPPTGTPAPQPIPPGLQSPMSLAVPARFSIPPAPQQQPAPAPTPVPPGLQSPMSLGVPSRPATSAPPPPPVVTQQPPPPLLVPPGLQSPMSLTVPARPATSAPPAPPVIATPGSWQPHPPGRMSPMSLGLPLVQPPQGPSTPGPGPPPPPIPSGVVPFAQGAPGGDRDPEIRMFRSVMPGEIPATGHAMPRLQGRGYAAPPPARAEDVEVLWEAPPEPAEPPGPSATEIVLGEAQRAAGALYDLGRILAPEPYVPPSKAKCGAIRKLGTETLRCARKRGHPGMHSDRGVKWG